MLLSLQQSELAVRLTAVSAGIADLLGQLAAAEPDDCDQILASWQHAPPKKEAVAAVLDLPTGERAALHETVVADLSFDAEPADPNFEFRFSQLPETIREAGKALLVSMYNDVFRGPRGFSLPDGKRANRKTWEQAFRDANPGLRVCPACLIALLEDPIQGRSAVDADHYLPKAIYPALSVHGLNLVPLCGVCNRTAKGTKNPFSVGGHTEGLSNIWFPYRDAGVDEITISFSPAEDWNRVATVQGTPGAERKAVLFDALFRLSERWSQTLESIHNSLRNQLLVWQVPAEPEALEAHLEKQVAVAAKDWTSQPQAFIAFHYFTWLAGNERAIAALAKEIE